MKYIEVVNWDKFQHYKDRRPNWVKLYIEIIEEFDGDGDSKKFHSLPDDSKLTFLMILCLRAHFNKHVPFPSEKWLKRRLGIKRVRLQPLVDSGFIVIDTDSVSEPYQADTVCLPPEREREREKEKEICHFFEEFEKARKLYPGTKRGGQTEFADFRRKHPDWRDACAVLCAAIEVQIQRRKELIKKREFVPPWKHLKTYLNQRCWESDIG